MFEWGDIRIFLAVAREGSTLRAGRQLNLNQTTVSRRLDALERALGLTLFARDTRGSMLTADGTALMAAAIGLEAAAGEVARQSAELARAASDSIRVSAAPMVVSHWVAPIVAEFRRRHGRVFFDLDVSEEAVSLESGEADVAFRPSDAIRGETLIARRLGFIPWALYCSDRYAAERGIPRTMDGLVRHPILFYSQPFVDRMGLLRRLSEEIPAAAIVSRLNSVTGMSGAIRSGAGIGPAPVIDGDSTPGLVFCFEPPECGHPLWLVAGPAAYRRPVVRAFMKLAGETIPRGRWLQP